MSAHDHAYDDAANHTVALANQLLQAHQEADPIDIADGLLAGAIHYWLYANQPCGDKQCEDCLPISTAELRLVELQKLVKQMAEHSDFFHSPNDSNAAHA